MNVAAPQHSLPLLWAGQAPLVGRAGPLATLTEYLAQARASRGSVALVTGAPGIGKTGWLGRAARRS